MAWNGLKISEMFFEEYGRPMLEGQFAPWKDRVAAGLVGQTSECFGYDDWISRDHDFAPGFCLWIPEELRSELAEPLQAAYDALPADEFICRHRMDVGMAPDSSLMTGARGKRVGVHSIEEFYFEHTGLTGAPQTADDWMKTEQMYLAEATNGRVFTDPEGTFTAVRNVWLGYYPSDVLKKKVAGNCAMAGKTGQFNYERCLKRGDTQAAYWCCTEFIHKASAALFLLNGRYMPYYKWRDRAMQDFSVCVDAVPMMERLTQLSEADSGAKTALMEDIAGVIIAEIKARGWSKAPSDYLLDHARQIMKTIEDPELAKLNVFIGED